MGLFDGAHWLGRAVLEVDAQLNVDARLGKYDIVRGVLGFSEHMLTGSDRLADAADAADALANEIDRANRAGITSRRAAGLGDRLESAVRTCWGWGRSKLRAREGDWLSAAIDLVRARGRVVLTYPDLAVPAREPGATTPNGDPATFRAYAKDLHALADELLARNAGTARVRLPRRKGRPRNEPELRSLATWAIQTGRSAEEVARVAARHGSVARFAAGRRHSKDEVAAWTDALAKAGVPRQQRDLASLAAEHVRKEPGIHTEALIKKLRVSKKIGRATIQQLIAAGAVERQGRQGLRLKRPTRAK